MSRLLPLAADLGEPIAVGGLSYDQRRSRRAPGAKRRRAGIDLEGPLPIDYWRPRTRGDCIDGERPCPYVSCRHHLAFDVTPAGTLIEIHPDRELEELAFTCSLDVAERGGTTLEAVGATMNLTRERIRQVEHEAIEKVRDRVELRATDRGAR